MTGTDMCRLHASHLTPWPTITSLMTWLDRTGLLHWDQSNHAEWYHSPQLSLWICPWACVLSHYWAWHTANDPAENIRCRSNICFMFRDFPYEYNTVVRPYFSLWGEYLYFAITSFSLYCDGPLMTYPSILRYISGWHRFCVCGTLHWYHTRKLKTRSESGRFPRWYYKFPIPFLFQIKNIILFYVLTGVVVANELWS